MPAPEERAEAPDQGPADSADVGADPRLGALAEARFTSELLERLSARSATSRRYRLQGEVASGGMGAILRVFDEDLRRHLAMKVILGQEPAPAGAPVTPVDPGRLARFVEEAQVTGQLDHPGIVPVHELGLDAAGRVYFTMKLVQGRDLETILGLVREGREGWSQVKALGVLQKACQAVAYAHHKGVIHRDLKPGNVMVGRYGEVYVMDWGLAKLVDDAEKKDIRVRTGDPASTGRLQTDRREHARPGSDSPLCTMDGDVLGTPAYMPPEQAAGRIGEMGPHSDVYALGAMLYHLLAGLPPYSTPASARIGNHALLELVRSGPPPSLHELAPAAPAELVAICEKAMAREPRERYADVAALTEDLSAYLEGRVVHAYETGAWAEARKWIRRNTSLAAALAAALVLALGGLGGIGFVQAKGRAAEKVQRERADKKTEEAERNFGLARRSQADAEDQRELAEEERRRAEAETAKVLRLADVKRLQELEAEAEELWPPLPARIAALESWAGRAVELAGNLRIHRATLAEMRELALPYGAAESAHDRLTHPRAQELAERSAELKRVAAALETQADVAALTEAEARLAQLEPEVQRLTDEVNARRTWRFPRPEEQWQHDVLVELIGGLERLESGLLAGDAARPPYGWSVRQRLACARELRAAWASGGDHERRWSEARPALLAAYPRLDVPPQAGLLPLGPDPDSGLWEFAHLMTGEPAVRGADGRLVLTERTGLVLVLLPGGSFWMGAQAQDPAGRNYAAQASADEGPVHEVELSPFFLSKYELTQGQWERLTGVNPSSYQRTALAPTLLHPLEQVPWSDGMTWLPRVGLAMPTEAQWEYGARGGTDTPWWTGAERESLRAKHAANLADQAAARGGAQWTEIADWPELDDGYVVHAPVGTFAANPFGLHEVAGNVWEWCLDGYEPGFYRRSPKRDPLAPAAGKNPVTRGGGFTLPADRARSAYRLLYTSSNSGSSLGLRPARPLER